MARWDFTKGLTDIEGDLPAVIHGGARLTPEGLKLDSRTGFAATVPLTRDLRAKTLEAWVSLDNVRQAGAGVLGVQSLGGEVFDSIVFAEKEAGQWLAGSDNFKRTQSFHGPAEESSQRVIHIAIVYADDGTISAYRDGKPYGAPYKSSGPSHFRAGQAQFILGMRHAPAGGNRMLAGSICAAQVYDRALTPAEVAASALSDADYLPTSVLLERLGTAEADRWHGLQAEIAKPGNAPQSGGSQSVRRDAETA